MIEVPTAYVDFAAGRPEPRFTEWLRARAEPAWTDAVGPQLPARREARVERLFRRTVDCEVAFFDAAYHPAGEDA